MINHVSNKNTLIIGVNILNIIIQNVVSQSGSYASYSVGPGD